MKNVASGTYLAKCNGCWNNVIKSSWDDSAFVHVKDPSEGDWAKWTIALTSNQKYSIRGDNGEYLNVCNQCVVGGRWKDYAFVEVDNPEELDIAQWEITKVEE